MAAANEFVLHHFRLRPIQEFASECFLDFGVAAWDCVADYYTVWRRREMFAFITMKDVDAELLKHRRHRRIHVKVRSGYVMTACLEHPGKGSHRGAADADQVVVHLRIALPDYRI
jgi:hypothetical protein